MSLYFVEIQPRIQAAHVALSGCLSSIHFSCTSVSHAGMSLSTKDVECNEYSDENEGKRTVICNWGSPSLIFNQSPTVKIFPTEALYFRFKTQRNISAEELLSEAFPTTQDELSPSVTLKCGFCGLRITKQDIPFKRVLPLPSESWHEFSGSVFCHAHDHTPSQLAPREGDLLIGDSVFLLEGSSLDHNNISLRNHNSSDQEVMTQQLQCKRCLYVFGSLCKPNGDHVPNDVCSSLKGVSVELQRTRISVKQSKILPTLSQKIKDRGDYFAQKLYTFSKTNMAFRFKVQDQRGKIYLAIWMLNSISRILHNYEVYRHGVLGRFSGCDGGVSSDLNEGYALKVMFKSRLDDSASTITADIDSDCLELDSNECLELLLLLSHSNRVFPPSQRTANGYKIGLLQINCT